MSYLDVSESNNDLTNFEFVPGIITYTTNYSERHCAIYSSRLLLGSISLSRAEMLAARTIETNDGAKCVLFK